MSYFLFLFLGLLEKLYLPFFLPPSLPLSLAYSTPLCIPLTCNFCIFAMWGGFSNVFMSNLSFSSFVSRILIGSPVLLDTTDFVTCLETCWKKRVRILTRSQLQDTHTSNDRPLCPFSSNQAPSSVHTQSFPYFASFRRWTFETQSFLLTPVCIHATRTNS